MKYSVPSKLEGKRSNKIQITFLIKLTFWALVNNVWMILFREDMKLEDARVNKIMSDEEAVLFTFEPALSAWKPDGSCLSTDFIVDVVHVTHVPLQFDRFFANQL